MIELTEQQEREMIERAKAGDAEANYNMSLWALEQAMAEPEEERWNRLAAKCLVKSAEAGYAPAKERMESLIRQLDEEKKAAAVKAPAAAAPEPLPEAVEEPEPAPIRKSAPGGAFLDTVKTTAAAAGEKVKGFFQNIFAKKQAQPASEEGAHASGRRKLLDVSGWGDAEWKRLRLISIIVCVVLAILLAVLIISGRKGAEPAVEEPAIPAAPTAEPAEPTATPVVILYPEETVRAEIAAADLDVFPEDEEYVTEETTAKVSTNGSVLKLRRGPGTSYNQIGSMDNGTEVAVYARHDGWALVKHGDTWGWCSDQYLK